MINFHKQRILFGCALLLIRSSYAFSPKNKTSLVVTFADPKRQDVFEMANNRVQDAERATESSATTTSGSIVEITIVNLGGEVGKMGTIRIQLRPDWAPLGVARFEELVANGFYNNCRFFRVLPNFIAQVGMHGDPDVNLKWKPHTIQDDPVSVSNRRGTVVFATAGPNTRTTQIFFNTRHEGNASLDDRGFSPFGEVIEGMDVLDQLYADYGEGPPSGDGPSQDLIRVQGNSYLESAFPKLSYIAEAVFASKTP